MALDVSDADRLLDNGFVFVGRHRPGGVCGGLVMSHKKQQKGRLKDLSRPSEIRKVPSHDYTDDDLRVAIERIRVYQPDPMMTQEAKRHLRDLQSKYQVPKVTKRARKGLRR